jgi:hypothetical protein
MSRLFTRLEKMDQDHGEGTQPVPPAEPGYQADVNGAAFAHATFPSSVGGDNAALAPTAAAMPPLVPGYAISSSLAMPALPGPVATRPVWPVRIWLVSLLLLVGLALLILAVPERLLPLSRQQRPALPERVQEVTTPSVRAPSAAPTATVLPPRPTVPSASTVAIPIPTPRASRAETRSRAAAPVPATPVAPPEDAACSAAMLAMNLCSKSSP